MKYLMVLFVFVPVAEAGECAGGTCSVNRPVARVVVARPARKLFQRHR